MTENKNQKQGENFHPELVGEGSYFGTKENPKDILLKFGEFAKSKKDNFNVNSVNLKTFRTYLQEKIGRASCRERV